MRRSTAFIVTLFLTFISCESDSDSYKLSANAFGFENDTEVFIYQVDSNNQPQVIDTLKVTNEKFEARYSNSSDSQLHLLKINGVNKSLLYFGENEDIKFNIYKDSILSSYATGGRQNELYNEFNNTIKNLALERASNTEKYKQAQAEQDGILITELRAKDQALAQQEKDYKREFVSQNNNSIFSLMLMSEMLTKKELSAAQVNELIKNLSPKMASHSEVKRIKSNLAKSKTADVGSVAPAFSAPTPEGEMLALNDVLGKYTIIDFWASWCKPCRRENPNVVNVYNQYHDKGLNIISVSLDRQGQENRWTQAIEQDKMDWYHVSNLKFWQDPIARTYNVRSIPATFLLDQNGIIIAKNLRGQALHRKIASLLGTP